MSRRHSSSPSATRGATTSAPEGAGALAALRNRYPGAIVRPFGESVPGVHPSAWLAPTSVVVGDVQILEECSVWYGVVVRGDVQRIRIGPQTNIQDNSVIHVTEDRFSCEIGARVTIGHRAVVHGCVVKDDALIGIGAIVLDGAEVGEGALIGAGAVVTPGTVIADRMLALGTPARVIRPLTAEERRVQLERTLKYVETAQRHATATAT